jgi:hypothetical protein
MSCSKQYFVQLVPRASASNHWVALAGKTSLSLDATQAQISKRRLLLLDSYCPPQRTL